MWHGRESTLWNACITIHYYTREQVVQRCLVRRQSDNSKTVRYWEDEWWAIVIAGMGRGQDHFHSLSVSIIDHDNNQTCNNRTNCLQLQGGAKKRGHRPSYLIENILKTPWLNCMKSGGHLQYYMLNTVINFLFKNNFIALWRHLAKTLLLSFIHTEHHTVAVFLMKFLNKKS